MREEQTLQALGAADPAAENMILRAALADAQRRIRELEEGTETDALTGLADGRTQCCYCRVPGCADHVRRVRDVVRARRSEWR